jgi:hypothetical protein
MTIGISGTNLIINWPTNAGSYTLMSGTNLNSSAGWSAVLASPVIVNGHNTVINPIAGTQMFLYLSQQPATGSQQFFRLMSFPDPAGKL